MRYLTRTIAPLVAVASMTTGCVSMRPTMTSFSVDYNRVVADTRNRMILLNIVRSAYREPTYYTAFDHIEGSLNVQASVSGEIANLLGGDATAFKPTVNGSLTNAPTFTIIPLNSEDFAKGMLQPIRADTIQLFLSQGWRSKLLAPLLVQKVECLYDDEVFGEIDNEPGHPTDGVKPEDYERITFSTRKAEASPPYTFRVPTADVLKALAGGILDKFDLTQASQPYDQALTTVKIAAQTDQPLDVKKTEAFQKVCRNLLKEAVAHPDGARNVPNVKLELVGALEVSDLVTTGSRRSNSAGQRKISLNLVFRSTDAIVYYLGELVRAKFGGHGPKQDSDGDPLFDLGRNASGPTAVAVTHRGVTWSIPARELGDDVGTKTNPRDRSLEVLALLNQLIAAQTSSKEFSRAPSSVRVR